LDSAADAPDRRGRRSSDRELPKVLAELSTGQAALVARQGAHEDVCDSRHLDNKALIAEIRSTQQKTVLFLLSFAGSAVLMLGKLLLAK
jgi:hypothetical protein